MYDNVSFLLRCKAIRHVVENRDLASDVKEEQKMLDHIHPIFAALIIPHLPEVEEKKEDE